MNGGSAGRESAYSVGDLGSIPGLGRSPGEGNGYAFQYSGLENTVHGVTKNWTQLSDFHFHLTSQLIYNVVLVSGVQQSSWSHIYMYSFFFRYFSHLGYNRILSRVPCAL